MNPNEAFKKTKREEFKVEAKEAVCWACSKITEKYVVVGNTSEGTKTPYCTSCFIANKHRGKTV